MRPFPPIDEFEFGERHALIDPAVFRDQFVFSEGLQPVGFGERWDGAEKRLPFSDRQAGMGEARGTANDHHSENEKGREPEPGADQGTRLQPAVKISIHGLADSAQAAFSQGSKRRRTLRPGGKPNRSSAMTVRQRKFI